MFLVIPLSACHDIGSKRSKNNEKEHQLDQKSMKKLIQIA